MGMVGGGRGAFIGAVHRMAAALDGSIDLVCGALSSDPATARASGRDLLLDEDRCYGSWREMIDREARREASERMDFVAIVTPNHLHHPVAMAALDRGFDVVCDKPMTIDLAQALALRDRVESSGRLFCLTHNYTGYPMVKEAKSLIASGRLGPLRKVVVEYPQGWLAERLEATGQKQASWRTDPARAGAAGCMGDIGTHCHQLAEYVTGLEVEALCADLTTFVPGRALDDDGNVLLRFAGAPSAAPESSAPAGVVSTTPAGARGVLHASQISVGEENGLRLRVYGEQRRTRLAPGRAQLAGARVGPIVRQRSSARPLPPCRRLRSARRACRWVIPKASSRPSPTSTATSRWRSRRAGKASRSTEPSSTSPPSTTACAACGSSTRWSRARERVGGSR